MSTLSTFVFDPAPDIDHDHDFCVSIRVIERGGEPWFVAADVCKALDHTNTAMALKAVDDLDKCKVSLGLPGRSPILVNESGLYKLIMRSDKPEAKRFQDWVTRDVLPSIRKHGGYIQGQETGEMSELELMAKAVLVAQRVNQELEEKNRELTPKAEAFDAYLEKDNTFTATDTAKQLGVPSEFLNNSYLLGLGVLSQKKTRR